MPSLETAEKVGQSWDDRLARARESEVKIHAALERTLRTLDPKTLAHLQSAHIQSIKQIAEAERIALKARTDSGQLVHIDTVRALWREVFPPLRQAIERLPMQARAKCNPDNPTVAEKALKTEVRAILVTISKLDTKFVSN